MSAVAFRRIPMCVRCIDIIQLISMVRCRLSRRRSTPLSPSAGKETLPIQEAPRWSHFGGGASRSQSFPVELKKGGGGAGKPKFSKGQFYWEFSSEASIEVVTEALLSWRFGTYCSGLYSSSQLSSDRVCNKRIRRLVSSLHYYNCYCCWRC